MPISHRDIEGDNPNSGVRVSVGELVRLRDQLPCSSLKGGRRSPRSPLSGVTLSPFRGRGMEFEEVRPYQPGDDIRHMDWRVTARTGHPHTKLFREERESPLIILVDLNPSMAFGTRVAFKSVVAARVAALLAWNGARHGDRIGSLLLAAGREWMTRPAGGKRGVLPLLAHLDRCMPVPSPGAAVVPMAPALDHLEHLLHPGSRLFLVSDCLGLDGGGWSRLGALSRHQEVALVHIFDPLEAALPAEGELTFTDGDSRLSAAMHRSPWCRRFSDLFQERRRQLLGLCRRYRVSYTGIATDQPLVAALGPFLVSSSRRGA
ncbi:MAG: DUF58 domain-containing protein [Magnetococcales bacterium]|nr:DUF58 domain-containing protein [Magnetococcales bacterium]